MIKILTACGTGINSSHQIKATLEGELRARGHDVVCDAVVINTVTAELMDRYDVYAQIAKTDFGFEPPIPVVDAGPILYRLPALAEPVFEQVERIIQERGLS